MAEEISKAKVSLYSRLGSRKQREKTGLFLAEGQKCVNDTLDFFQVESILVRYSSYIDESKYSKYNVLKVNDSDMGRISQFQTLPDIIAVYRMPPSSDIDIKLMTESLTLMLDAVQDPGNLGTILRIASWFGIEQVILGNGCADPFNPKAVQSSMGAVGMVKIIQTDLIKVIESNPEIPVYGTLLDGENIYDSDLSMPAFVVMGNEGNGLSEGIRARVNKPILIPSFAKGPHAESLNVAAATAVTISEFQHSSHSFIE